MNTLFAPNILRIGRKQDILSPSIHFLSPPHTTHTYHTLHAILGLLYAGFISPQVFFLETETNTGYVVDHLWNVVSLCNFSLLLSLSFSPVSWYL